MARRERKTAAQAWLERWNPLQGMSIREAQNIFDVARNGDTQRLHWLFQEIEATNPVLLVCVERRSSAIANFQWKISENAASDGSLSAEQKDAAERFLNGVENLTDTLENMDLAFFRGFAHAQPVWEADGTVKEVQLLDSWKFVRQGGAWFYNPACTGFSSDMQPTDRCGLMTVVRRRPIDYPALAIHIRHAVGSRDWGRFLERYALPKPAVFMHPGATNDQRADYIEAANAVENGQVSVWPAGASLTDFAGGSRGTDPFGSFIEHQEKQIVLLATGGTLMSLAESGSGTLAGGAQSEVWESIVARDSSVIAQAVQRAMVIPYLVRAFPGKPVAVSFGFDFTKPPTPKEVFEVAALAKQAGWRIDQAQLEEQTGYTLAEDTTPSSGGVSASPSGGYPFLNKAPHSPKAHEGNPGIPAGGPRSVTAADGTEAVLPSAVLKAFAEDTGAAAAAVRKLLENPTPDGAAALLHDLPSLIPEDPALASVIAEAMAAEFRPDASAQPDAVATNKEGVCTSPNGPAGCKSPTCPGASDLSNLKDDQGEGLSEKMKNSLLKGHESIEAALRSKTDVIGAMDDPELGLIDFRWDAHGFGIKHIIERRNAFRDNGHPEAISGEDMVRMLPSVIARGERRIVGKGLRRDVEIDFKGLHVVLTPSLRGKPTNHWVMTGYDINSEAAGYRK